jgi:hypothetical protein
LSAADAPRLDEITVDSDMIVVSAWPDGLATVARPDLEISIWDGDGDLLTTCTPTGLAGRQPLSVAARRDRLLMTFDTGAKATQPPPKGKPGGGTEVVVVDVHRCRIERRYEVAAFPPMVRFVAAQDGWLQVGVPGLGHDPQAIPRDDRGEAGSAIEMPVEYLGDIERRFRRPEAIGVLPVPAGKRDTWFLPVSTYEWWIPGTAAHPARRVQPPQCLRQDGRELSGVAAVDAFIARGRTDDERARLSEIAESLTSDGQPFTLLEPSARPGFVASTPSRVAVLVRSPEKEAWRLDLWDPTAEAVVAIITLPTSWTPRRVGLGDDAAWVLVGERFHRVELPADAVLPLDDPCDESSWTHVGDTGDPDRVDPPAGDATLKAAT